MNSSETERKHMEGLREQAFNLIDDVLGANTGLASLGALLRLCLVEAERMVAEERKLEAQHKAEVARVEAAASAAFVGRTPYSYSARSLNNNKTKQNKTRATRIAEDALTSELVMTSRTRVAELGRNRNSIVSVAT